MLAYGNIQAGPWEWTADPAVRDFFERRRTGAGDMLGFQLAFDVTGDPSFPEKAAFEVARELGLAVTTHAGVWGATNDDGIRLIHENGFATPENIYVHAATLSADSYQRIAASGGSISVSTESEQSAGQGYPPTWQVRQYGIPVSLSMDTSVWWSGDLFSAMRTTLGADRSREHLEAHVKGDTVTALSLRAEHVVDWATRGGARALGRDDLGRLTPGRQGRRRPDQERRLARLVPAAQPLRPRRLPGAARRRAHGDRGRSGREERRQAGRLRRRPPYDVTSTPRSTTCGRRWATRLARRHAPRAARGQQGARQPVPVHRLPVRGHARRTRHDVRRPGLRTRRVSPVAGRGSGPDFVESLARGLDVLRCFDEHHRGMSLAEVATATGSGAADGAPAAADARGARLRPLCRRCLLADAEGDHARHGVRRVARAVGRRPPPPRGAGPPDR